MKKILYSITFLIVITIFSLELTSCKDDEPEKFNLKVSNTTLTAKESDLEIEVGISLDKAAPEDITVKFKLTGTAYDDVRADTEGDDADFEVDGEYDEIVIAKGETSAIIKLIPYSDTFVENDETIIVTITEVKNNPNVILDSSPISTVTLTQEDGIAIYLEWPTSNTTDGFVDMDMFIRVGASTSSYDGILTGSIYDGFDRNYELVFIPKTFIGTFLGFTYTNTTYGLSYTYYDGTRDDLKFEVTFAKLINGNFEPEASQQIFTNAVSYTKNNINKWTTEYPTIIAQTFANVGGNYQDFSEITTQESSSRTGIATTNEFVENVFGKLKTRSEAKHYSLPEKYRSQLRVK